MRNLWLWALVVSLPACVGGYYTRAEFVYGEPAAYAYVTEVDRVVFVTRDVLVAHGYVVWRVERSGPRRIVWARRGDDEVVRIFVTPEGRRVYLRGLTERRDRGKHKGWVRGGRPDRVLVDIDVRLRG
ncbi:MAG: hypothetical protein ACREN5_12370 [Gemmatimonadales bacterium]